MGIYFVNLVLKRVFVQLFTPSLTYLLRCYDYVSLQVRELRSRVGEYEERIRRLKAAAELKRKVQDSLITVTQSLAALYHLLCEANNETPSRYEPLGLPPLLSI